MTRTELLELIRNGESSSVEFKRDVVEPRGLAEEVVAFANTYGGRVLLGVDDDGSVVGLTRDRLDEWVVNICRDKVRPELVPHYEVIRDVEPGRDVAVVYVAPSYTVHSLWHNQHRYWYIRAGTENREANEQELGRVLQRRGSFRQDLRPVPGTSIGALDRRRLRDYFEQVRDQSAPPDEDEDAWRTLLLNTEILAAEGEQGEATLAGTVLFATSPNRFLPQAGISAVAYPGTEKDYAAVERTVLRGPMVRLGPLLQPVENGLPEQALAFVGRNAGVTSRLTEGGARRDRPAYPTEAVREAVVNALVHRDYILASTDIELSLFSDRLEVVSPGRLPNGITVESMRVGSRASRNELLKEIMRDYKYIESSGLGVPRKIIRLMKEHNASDAELLEDRDGERFTVRLMKEPKP